MSSTRKHYKYEYITSRWGGMQLREDMDRRIEDWLSGFAPEERVVMLELLSNFYYYSEKRIKEKVIELYRKFSESFADIQSDVVYTKIIKENGASFSDIFFTSFWLTNNLYDYAEPNIFSVLDEDVVPSNLAIVDDYSGTGKTFIKTVNKLMEANGKIAESTLYFLTLHITQRAEDQIHDYSSTVGIPINIVSIDTSKETFKEDYLFEKVKSIQLKKQYADICANHLVQKDYIFGFEDVASLVALHYNTPNNTLGLFWNDLTDFAALFPRHKKQNTSLKTMQQKANDRKKRRQQIVTYGIEDARLATIMAYCVANSSKLSLDNLRNDFGLTSEQLDNVLRSLIKQGYITIDKSIIIPTAKLKSHMFVSRLNRFRKSFEEKRCTEESAFSVHNEYVPINFK